MAQISNRMAIADDRGGPFDSAHVYRKSDWDDEGRWRRHVWTYRSDEFTYRIKHFPTAEGKKFFMIILTPFARMAIVDRCPCDGHFHSHKWVRQPADTVLIAILLTHQHLLGEDWQQ